MRKNHIKKIFPILFFILLLLIGYFIGYNIGKILSFLPETYFNVSLFVVIGTAFLSYVFSVIIHELSHAIAFMLQGMKIRAIILGPFAFINKGKWTLTFNYNKILKSGGMVVPIIPSINNKSVFLSIKNKYSYSILTAPLVSLCFGILSMVFVILTLIRNWEVPAFIFVFLLWTVFISIIINLSSLIKTPIVYGDYPAAKHMKKNCFFAAQQIYSYMCFMEDGLECRKNSEWLVNYISEELKYLVERKDSKLNEIICLDAVNTIIMEDLIGFRKNSLIEKLCNYYLSDIHTLTAKEKSENHKILFVHILYWLNNNSNRQIEEYIDLCDNLFANKEVQKYYTQQIDLVIKNNNNEELSNIKNIKNTSLYSLYRIFEGFYFDELQLNLKCLSNE